MYQILGDILNCRDFNARWGCKNDCVTNDLDNFIPISSRYIVDYSKGRLSKDLKTKICKANNY